MTLDLNTENALIELVRDAAQLEIMPRFRNLPDAAVQVKSSAIDVVTEADLRAEERISNGIDSILPGALVVGEEAVAADPSVLDGLADAEVAVIIDPVDGTWNFANGVAAFGVILAVSVRGQTVFGLLYDPVLDDWVLARRGGGAWFVAKDKAPRALKVAAERPYAESSGFIPHYLFTPEEQVKLAPGLIAAQRVSGLCCSCHEFRMMAMGNCDFIQTPKINAWDHAAGVLAVEEAGGFAQLVDGRVYAPGIRDGKLTVATGPTLHAEVIRAFDL